MNHRSPGGSFRRFNIRLFALLGAFACLVNYPCTMPFPRLAPQIQAPPRTWTGGVGFVAVVLTFGSMLSACSAQSGSSTHASVSSSSTSKPTTTAVPRAAINPAAIPIGDGRVSSSPQVGHIDSCTTAFRGGGAAHVDRGSTPAPALGIHRPRSPCRGRFRGLRHIIRRRCPGLRGSSAPTIYPPTTLREHSQFLRPIRPFSTTPTPIPSRRSRLRGQYRSIQHPHRLLSA